MRLLAFQGKAEHAESSCDNRDLSQIERNFVLACPALSLHDDYPKF
jgi:hypothetical protein